jgi:hypothetical protein
VVAAEALEPAEERNASGRVSEEVISRQEKRGGGRQLYMHFSMVLPDS